MLNSIISYIVTAILNWLAGLIGREAKKAGDAAADEKTNKDIEKGIEDAKNEKEAQDALNKAAGHLGRRP